MVNVEIGQDFLYILYCANQGGGDCDSDSECAGDLVCGTNNCVDFNAAAHPQYDCCVKPKGNYDDNIANRLDARSKIVLVS